MIKKPYDFTPLLSTPLSHYAIEQLAFTTPRRHSLGLIIYDFIKPFAFISKSAH